MRCETNLELTAWHSLVRDVRNYRLIFNYERAMTSSFEHSSTVMGDGKAMIESLQSTIMTEQFDVQIE